MNSVDFFNNIYLKPDRNAIFRRLGYVKEKTKINEAVLCQMDAYLEEAVSVIALQGCAVILKIEGVDKDIIKLEQGIVFESKDLAKFLNGANEALLMGATAGHDVMDAIYQKDGKNDMTRAVILDAAAGEMVDDALTWMTQYYQKPFLRENKKVDHRRFSCGYGDFALENQKVFYDTLKMSKMDVILTDDFLMSPEKSVTALTGIYSIDEKN